jgi:pyruvate kinase
VPIVVLTDQDRTWRQLSLVWGVTPFRVPHAASYDEMAATARALVVREGLAATGDRVVITAGVPFDVPGSTNTLKVETI